LGHIYMRLHVFRLSISNPPFVILAHSLWNRLEQFPSHRTASSLLKGSVHFPTNYELLYIFMLPWNWTRTVTVSPSWLWTKTLLV
jgi:hypothetical protein